MDKKEIEENFEILKEFLAELSKNVEKNYIENENYPRFKRLHKWYQNKKDLDILVTRLNHVKSNILFMVSDATR
jgi:DNA-binding transcriptional regulator GbsR (MarR family)